MPETDDPPEEARRAVQRSLDRQDRGGPTADPA